MRLTACVSLAVLAAAAVAEPEVARALDMQSLRGASYAGIYDEPVALTAGRYEGEPFVPGGASRPTLTLVDELVARGDLDGNGRHDAAVLLVENSGGSGSFVYLAAVLDREGAAVNAGTVLLGDRVSLRELRIADGVIIAETLVHASDDAMPRPTHKRRVGFAWRSGSLVEISREDGGPLSLADLAGTAWRLLSNEGGGGRVADTEVTAEFFADRVAGTAGCNRYSGGVSDAGAAALAIGPLISTRMACAQPVMEQETAYLSALEAVTEIGFSFGRLRLSGAESRDALLFAPGAPP